MPETVCCLCLEGESSMEHVFVSLKARKSGCTLLCALCLQGWADIYYFCGHEMQYCT
jgi:hypothetical protein